MTPRINIQLGLKHRWLIIGCLLDNLMAREAVEMESEGRRKDYEITDMIISRIDKALTDEFKQQPLTEIEIIELKEGIDIITTVAETKTTTIVK